MPDEPYFKHDHRHIREMSPSEASALIDQYKLFVEQTVAISGQRAEANRFFVTLNAVLLAAYGFVWEVDRIAETTLLPILMSTAAISGVIACWRWRSRIRSYKTLLRKRFQIIEAMELGLPYQPYREEAEFYSKGGFGFWKSELQPAWGFTVLHAAILASVLGLTVNKLDGAAPPIEICGWFKADLPMGADPCVPVERRFELQP